jgi:hypothetical protein
MVVREVSTDRSPSTRRRIIFLAVIGVSTTVFGAAIIFVLLVFTRLIECQSFHIIRESSIVVSRLRHRIRPAKRIHGEAL